MIISKEIIIGSRTSTLAIKQTEIFISKLRKVGANNIRTLFIKSKGDKINNNKFKSLGGKGLLIDSKKPTEVATVVHEVLQDSQILNSLVNDGYQRADELSFEVSVEAYKKVLSPLIFS